MFTLTELIKATGGQLLRGDAAARVRGVSTDSRTVCKNELFIALGGSNFDGHAFIKAAAKKGAACVIVDSSRADLGDIPAAIKVKDTTRALGDIARFHRKRFAIPVIAVTGSNGKTTTKDMLAWILSRKFKVLKNEGTQNNHIGVPMTLLKLDKSYDFAVIEMGTNHFGEIRYLAGIACATIGVITNIGPSHLQYLKNLAGVYKEKRSLLDCLEHPSIAVLNGDDSFLRRELVKESRKNFALGYGVKSSCDYTVSKMRAGADGVSFSIANRQEFMLKSLGRYNVYNALAAIAVARLLGMEYEEIARRLNDFVFPKGRLQFVRQGALTFIDDTYNANPLSFECALDSVGRLATGGRKIVVMGDMRELGKCGAAYHREIGKQASEMCDVMITVGPLSGIAASWVKSNRSRCRKVIACDSSIQAKEALFKKIKPGPDDIILVKGSRSMKMEEVFKTHAL